MIFHAVKIDSFQVDAPNVAIIHGPIMCAVGETMAFFAIHIFSCSCLKFSFGKVYPNSVMNLPISESASQGLLKSSSNGFEMDLSVLNKTFEKINRLITTRSGMSREKTRVRPFSPSSVTSAISKVNRMEKI